MNEEELPPQEPEEAEEDIDWLSIPVKKNQATPKSSGKKKSKVTAPLVPMGASLPEEDERPIKAMVPSYDDVPVGVHNKQSNATNLLLMEEEEAR
mmetsp:Transcript_22986/g.35501  ORF Transcript_22986/g.35501 Transcript_22986/m.35501 type:complete len:95 (+) Transcript_22986:4097-4381(+)